MTRTTAAQALWLRVRADAPSRLVQLTALISIGGLSACTEFPFPPTIPRPPPTVVLTFDDGPLAADLAPPLAGYSAEQLLEPLRAILARLADNGSTAVFFIQGPDNEALSDQGRTAFAAVVTDLPPAAAESTARN